MNELYHKIRSCNDKNPKKVIRILRWGKNSLKIKLCEKCCLDSDFSNYIKEEQI